MAWNAPEAVPQTCLLLASASSTLTPLARNALPRNLSDSSRSAGKLRKPLSSIKACATTSSNVGPRPSACFGVSAPSSVSCAPRNSSNLRRESGRTTARALERAVPRFMKLPTAKPVLAHRRTSSDAFSAWQQSNSVSMLARKSASSFAGPTSNAPHASLAKLSGMELSTHKYLSGVSSWPMSWMSICRICSTASFCSQAAVCKDSTPSGGKHSGKSSRLRRMLATFSGGGSLLNAMASNCDDLSSKMRKRFLASSGCPGRRCGGALSAAAADPTARGCDKAKCFSSTWASNGAGA
mmetsp:Transcript_101562/g.293928  ORF Transcript_101562/g.293928 Transcript_101562/m.293928 type:complete len:296 (+) Transcript_101562:297-1184(+)